MSLEDQLIKAVKDGDLEEVKRIVDLGLDITNKDSNPMSLAIANGHLDIVKYFVNQGVSLEYNTWGKYAAFSDAIKYGHLDIVKYLVSRGMSVDSHEDIMYIAFSEAAERGYLDIVKYLIKQGVSARETDAYALRVAAYKGNLEVVKYLVSQGANIHAFSDDALSLALKGGHLDTVKYLVSKGATFNSDMIKGALQGNNLEVLKYLIKQGVSVPTELALKLACNSGNLSIVKYIVENIGVEGKQKFKALVVALYRGRIDVAEYLVSQGVDVNEIPGEALHTVIPYAKLDSIKFLVSKGVDIHFDDESALMLAVSKRQYGIVKYLLEQGADATAQDNYALNIALEDEDSEIVRLLVEYGADVDLISEEQRIQHGLLSREETEDVLFEKVPREYLRKRVSDVYHTLPNELLYKIRSYMKIKGLDTLDIKNVYNTKHPLYKEFGDFIEDKPFLLKNFVFRLEDLDPLLDSESDKFSLSYDMYEESEQQHLKYRDNLVIQLNFKEEYLDKIFDIQGSEFKDFYEEISGLSIRSGHPVLPFPGRTYGWARIYALGQRWLINEIQTDWKHLIAFCKQLSTIKPGEEFQGHRIDARMSEFFQTAEQREWGKFIGETMLENFDELIMSSILNVARRNGVHHIYMLTDKNMNAQDLAVSVKKELYHKTPRKFKFHKVVTDLGAGEQEYWYRTARRIV